LKQAEEVFAKGNVLTEGVSHPETFIRARALAKWQDQPEAASAHIRPMIEGAEALDELDVLGQQRMTRATRGLLEYFLQPKWMQSTAMLGHAKLFFDDFSPAAKGDAALLEGLKFSDPKLREYLCYVLLEADADVGEALRQHYALGLGGTIGVARGITERWRVSLSGRGMYYGLGDRHSLLEVTLAQSYAVTPNLSLSLDVSRNRTREFYYTEGKLALNLYF
jgi:hypothetical protein